MRCPRPPLGWLVGLALLLVSATAAIAETPAATPAAVPVRVHGTEGVTATLDLALDEVVLLRHARPRQAPARPALVEDTALLRLTASSAGIRVTGATSAAELIGRARALSDANPEWEIRLVVYAPGVKRGPRTRRLLTDEVAVVKADGTTVVEHATSPLAALDLAEALAARADVKSAAPLTAPPEHLQQRLRRKLAKVQRQDKPDERQLFHARKRLPPGERRIPVDRYFQAREHMRRMPLHSTAAGGRRFPSASDLRMSLAAAAPFLGAWTPLGPGNIGGRTRALVIDPNPPHTVYAGGVAGGVWKSTNAATVASGSEGQVTWEPLTDTLLPNLAIASLAIDPTNPMVLYAGTGEGVFNGDAVRGAGIFKSQDGGATWTHLAFTASDDFHFVNSVKALDATTVLAATGTGLWRSTDGGANWVRILNTEAVSGCLEIAVAPGSAYVLVSCGTFAQGTVYRSTTASADAFTAVLGAAVPSGSSGTRDTTIGRTALAISADGSVAYALASSIASGTFNHGLKAVYRSTDGGLTWTARVTNTSPVLLNRLLLTNPYFATESCSGSSFFFNQGWYDIAIAVDPTNPDRVWVGGIDLFRSDDGGASWNLASFWWQGASPGSYVHADQHAIVFHPAYGTANTMLFVANDGGIFRTTNPDDGTTSDVCAMPDSGIGIVWAELNNGYGVTQFYHGLPYPGPDGGNTFLGGTQDNGTIRGTAAGGIDGWTAVNGGDGGYVAVDPNDPNVLYTELTNLSLQKATNGAPFGTEDFVDAVDGITEPSGNFMFIAPFTMSPNSPQTLWIGGRRMWRTTNGAGHWVAASATFSGCGSVSAIAVAPGNDNLVLAGTEQGCLKRTTNGLTAGGTTTWTDVSSALPSAYLSSITFDPQDANTVYVTFSTFGVPHVWVSSDGGVSWRNIDGSGDSALPDVPAHTLAVAPGTGTRLYVGTDVGVFSSDDGGATWAVENTGFANVITEWLAVGQVGGTDHLFAFTHGRGAFRVALPTVREEVAATAATVSLSGGVAPGGTVPLDNTVKNVGGTTTPPFVVGFALVPVDASGTPTDPEIPVAVTRAVDSLAARASSRETTTIPMPNPLSPGFYRLRVTADTQGAVTGDPNADDNTVLSNTFAVANPDLTVTSLAVTPSLVDRGMGLTISHAVRNLNGPPATAPASQSAVYLTTGKDFATVIGPPIATIDVPALGPFAASPTITRTITVPMATPPGQYVVFVKANDSGAFSETDTSNNTRGATTTLTIGPDLVVSAASATPAALLPGGTLAIASTVKNQAATTTTSFAVSFALVPVGDPSGASDIPLAADRTVAGLATSRTSAATTSAVVPPGTARGPYRVRVRVDSGGAVAEANETNNTFLTSAAVTVARPDLVVPTVTAPGAVKTGTAFAVSHSVKNSSPLPAPGPFTVSLFLSTDTTVDGGDIPLGTRTIAALAANGTSTASTSVTIPDGTATGVYRILVQADSGQVVEEDDDTNNTGVSGPLVLGPDLVVTAAGVSPTAIAPGATVAVSNTVKNQGATPVGTTTLVGFFLSSDATLDGGDLRLAVSRSVPPLAAGVSSAAVTPLTMPVATIPGTYRILVVADTGDAQAEGDEANNVLASVPITVALPDLVVPTVTAPAAVKTAARFTVVNSVTNTASVAAPGPFAVSLFLSTDTTIDGGDILLGTRTVSGLAARGTSRASTALTVPDGTPIGVYRILVQADSGQVVVEADNDNNVGVSGPVVLGPDLIVTTARTTPTTTAVAPGGTVSVAETVKNQGAVATGGSSLVGFFLSSDPTLDAGDVALGASRAVAPINAGSSSSGTTPLTIPPATVPGPYFILVVADVAGAVGEGGEANNVASVPISVTLPDLVVSAISAPSAARTGTGLAIGTAVKNDAPVAAPGPFTVSLFLSTDETLDGGDTPLGTRTVGTLAANATSSASTTVIIPDGTPVDVYRILVHVDSGGAVVESDENNVGVSPPVSVGPELVVSTLTVPSPAIAGRSIAVSNAVKNTGAVAAAGFRVGLYLSADGTIDTVSDTLLASRAVAGLAAGASSTASTTVAVPAAMGDYVVGTVADDLAGVPEASELNNVAVKPLAVVPDLVIPTDVTASINFSVSGACGAIGLGDTNLRITSQTGAAFSGGRLLFFDSLGGRNTISFSGTVSSAGALAGTVTFSRSGGGGGTGKGTLTGSATDAGDLVLDINGTINVSGVGACPATAHVEYHPGP